MQNTQPALPEAPAHVPSHGTSQDTSISKAEKQLLRSMFRHRRNVIPADLASTTSFKAANLLRGLIAGVSPSVVALYIPRKGEVDLTRLAEDMWEAGQTVALPRVVLRDHPLVFNIWEKGAPLERDALGIPAATGAEIIPSILVMPMVGYNRKGYRLGAGGGYYDRTLAAFRQPVETIGVCYTELEIPEFPAEKHDLILDFIVTGKEVITCPKGHQAG